MTSVARLDHLRPVGSLIASKTPNHPEDGREELDRQTTEKSPIREFQEYLCPETTLGGKEAK
jgi:hypothetical protein